MASAHVAICYAGSVKSGVDGGAPMPVVDGHALSQEYLADDGITDIAAPATAGNYVAVVTCDSGPAWVRFGITDGSQLAKESGWWLVLEGQTREFALAPGESVEITGSLD